MPEYHNPQQEPGMERKLLLLIGLMFLTMILFQPLLKKYSPQPPPQPPKTEVAPVTRPLTSKEIEAHLPALSSGVGKQASSELESVIENDLYKITFTNRGGQVKSWILKGYKKDDRGQPLEVVNQASEKYGQPLSLWTYDEGLRNKLNSALYVASGSGRLVAPVSITFEYADQDIAVVKKFSFDHSYVVHVETSVRSKGNDVAALPMWPAGLGDALSPASYASSQIAYQYNDKIERLNYKKISGGNTVAGPFNWAGVSDAYFAAVFLPDEPQNTAMVTLSNPMDVPKDWQHPNPQDTTKVDVLGASVGNLHGPSLERLFVGPKSVEVLEAVPVATIVGDHPDLRGVVDFGWLGYIARPLFSWLKWTYKHMVANWGWAIVIQTLIINLALLPLRISQMKSMLKMQKVAPHIKSIQEKYKKYSLRDPRKQEMQQEISAVYKQHGVNPAGGCLPLLIQMPFLFAYYRMLGVAIDLRLAPWYWIHDLSSPDPWHLLPIGIVVTMFLTQRMTPQAGMDPVQQKMMNLMMPVMLGFVSLNLAAGLCLYWSVGNVVAILQQSVMNRTSLGREMREMMEKRARKSKDRK